MSEKFTDLDSISTIYDAQDEQADKKDASISAKEEQIDILIMQLTQDARNTRLALKKSYINANLDSAGIAMDLEVIEKKLSYNQELKSKLFA